jgi:uncharacterized membrane protein
MSDTHSTATTAGFSPHRIEALTDGIYAVAMTLLVIEVRVPEIHVHSDAVLGQALLDLLPKYIGFVVSFMVVPPTFWVSVPRLLSNPIEDVEPVPLSVTDCGLVAASSVT